MRDSLLIYSGGMDSTVLLHDRKDSIKLAVNFNYSSKHNERERECAEMNAQALGIPLLKINLGFINKYFKSNLLQSGGEIPEGHYEDESMKQTVVPFRNGIMLAIAVGLAESNDLDTVLYANHAGDHVIYPDCRRAFQVAMDEAAKQGTYNEVSVYSPYVNANKRAIALLGKRLGVDFSKTYSCYKGGVTHCGMCGTCVERKEALLGFDTTVYEGERL